MLDITKPIILNVTRANNQTVVFGKQGDYKSRYIICTLVDGYNNPLYIKPHFVATINARRGEEVKSFLCEVLPDGTIKAPLTSWMLQSEGSLKCEVVVFGPLEQRLASAHFTLVVQESVFLGENYEGDQNYNLLISLMADVSRAKESADGIALLSKSWAIGNTGVREGENENNAKYYKDGAEQYANIAANNLLNGVSTHNIDPSSHADIRYDIRQVEAIARGKANARVFNTLEELQGWLSSPQNTEMLNIGDNLYIRDVNVKDYWWDGTTAQVLEAEAPDLTNYYTKSEIDISRPILVTESEYNALVASGQVISDRFYDIIAGE